ncbi:MAG: phosphoenolpyruvate--protein phosphotransferase [Betaproteobacteria bacterium TMED82]|nr:MAG: phosphoenolpyruvate--protein phosphotransferase [Betaproteobacteria bacterium TMED82]|tara:strand:- start:60458 stop:62152 length:1695 start_codon:yes stop_codon:yes gene_type:complete
MFSLQGKGIGNDIIIGKARVQSNYSNFDVQLKVISEKYIPSEEIRLEEAIADLDNDLKEIIANYNLNQKEDFRNLIESHRLILNDSLLVKGALHQITKNKCNAEWALVQQLEMLSEQFDKIKNNYFRERKHDLEQLVLQLLNKLTSIGNNDTQNSNVSKQSANKLDPKYILIAKDILVTDLPKLEQQGILGFAIENGSPTSHIAILARSLEIPSIVGIQSTKQLILQGEEIILDAECGVLITGADKEVLSNYEARQKNKYIRKEKLQSLKHIECETTDKVKIKLMANIEQPEEAKKAIDNGAVGIGLLRSEFLFLNKNAMPTEEEHYNAYLNVLKTMNGKPVTIRTLDYGADKLMPSDTSKSINIEFNPALGQRAIRFCLANIQLFLTQLRAILRASFHGQTSILLPLITHHDEIIKCREIIQSAMVELSSRGQKFDKDIKIGAMIEVPSAAISISELIPYLDFASLGTNDLIQYTLAIDRTNNKVSNLYNPNHPAIMKLIEHVVSSCKSKSCPVSICGELAGDTNQTDYLLKIGLRNFSMNYTEILKVKEKILKSKVNSSFNQ